MESPIAQGFLGGLLAGLATGLGALGVYPVRELSRAVRREEGSSAVR